MFGSKNKEIVDQDEVEKIKDKLDTNEEVLVTVTQMRNRPGGTLLASPNTILVTDSHLIIRSPSALGMRENVEVFDWADIKSVKVENGLLSSSLYFIIEGLTELSKSSSSLPFIGSSNTGEITGLPKKRAEATYKVVKDKIEQAKKQTTQSTTTDDPLTILKSRYAKGEISKEEFDEMKKDLE